MPSRIPNDSRARSALLLLTLCAAVLGACAGSYPTPRPMPPLGGVSLPRFDRVADGVYRSAQPSAAHLTEVKARYGLATVVKLNRGSDVVPDGVTVRYHPLDALIEPSPQTVERILDEIDRAPKPVLIHCTHGEDRTGLIIALYKIRHGATVEEAYTDMMRRGFHPYEGVWRAWLRASGWDRTDRFASGG